MSCLQLVSNYSKKYANPDIETCNILFKLPKFSLKDDKYILTNGKNRLLTLYTNNTFLFDSVEKVKFFYTLKTEHANCYDVMKSVLEKIRKDIPDYKIYCDLKTICFTKNSDDKIVSITGDTEIDTETKMLFLKFFVNAEKKTINVSLWF